MPVYAAVGVRERLVSMDEPDDGADVDRIFAFNPLPGNYTVGPLTLSALDCRTMCRIQACASPSAISPSPTPAMPARRRHWRSWQQGANLLLAEASDRHQQPGVPPLPISGYHLSGTDAGWFAAGAGVGSLVLTHFWPGNDREATRAAAAAHFAGPIALAEEGMVVSLG